MNRHKAMRFSEQTCKKKFITLNSKNECKIKFTNNVQVPYLDQPQPDILYLQLFTLTYTNIL